MSPFSRGFRHQWLRPGPLILRRNVSTSVTTGRERFFRVSEEVQDALATGKPVVALETTIYTHGYPYPENVALSSRLESLVRTHGGVPATIGVLDGVTRVGMQPEELIQLISTAGSKDTWKLSRRDLGFIGGLGLRGQKLNGGTTIAGTMLLAHLAGIKIFATGGLGGVHRGGESSMDISADLTELGRTPVAVISSGCKSFLDIGRTLEYLETQGVGVGTFADGRDGDVDFPAFWARDSGVKSPQTVRLLFANPVPAEAAIAREDIDGSIAEAVAEAEQQGITGSANTPFILKRIREVTKGASVTANTALIESNIIRGTRVAVELAKLELRGGIAPDCTGTSTGTRTANTTTTTATEAYVATPETEPMISHSEEVDLLVAGAVANDTICDYVLPKESVSEVFPLLHTSNPSNISQSAGGVGRNVAVAAHLAGAKVALATAVADDIAGSSLLKQLSMTGLSTDHVRQLRTSQGARTAQYVAVNDGKKDLMLAMADMSILAHPQLESAEYWRSCLESSRPKWVIVDGNWSPAILSSIFAVAKALDIPTAFEPVSTAKSIRLFAQEAPSIQPTSATPNHSLDLAAPNALELTAMYTEAREAGYFETQEWWSVIDSFSLSDSGSRDKFEAITSRSLVEQGIPQQVVQLLPYIPNLIVKLGPLGCLLAQILKPGDQRLTKPESSPFILARTIDDASIGGIYMRLFPPHRHVADDEIVSVNGIGDTMLGVVMAGLVKGLSLEQAVPIGQEAAVLSLRSTGAVSPKVRQLRARLG